MQGITSCTPVAGGDASTAAIAFIAALVGVLVAAGVGKWLDPATANRSGPAARYTGADYIRLASPVIAALAVTAIFFGALWKSGFYARCVNEAPPFVRSAATSLISAEAASQLTWGVSAAAVLVTGLIVIWIAGDALRASQRKAQWLAGAVVAAAGVVAWYLVSIALKIGGFGGAISQAMLEGLTRRNNLPELFKVTDALNALAGGAAVAAVVTACLMAAPASDIARRAAAAELARRWTILDRLLYAGAAMLVAGMIEVIALHAWALAPFSGTAEVKAKAELCGKIAAVKSDDSGGCKDLKEDIERAGTVDELKKFVRALAITLGAGFSLLLASLYVPAAIVLQLRDARAGPKTERSDNGVEPAYAGAPGARLFKIAATVAPLATGLLSALVDMKFS